MYHIRQSEKYIVSCFQFKSNHNKAHNLKNTCFEIFSRRLLISVYSLSHVAFLIGTTSPVRMQLSVIYFIYNKVLVYILS